jgi:predicted transcriptional regulator of viral defense system
MEFKQLVDIVGDEPVFETGLLLAGQVDPDNLRKQLSRWVEAGKVYQLRRGLYALAPPFQKARPHPFLAANRLVQGSYVSCQSALAFYGMIPEYAPVVISVAHARPGRWDTPLGSYVFRHVKASWLHGYRMIEVAAAQQAFVATPEKALLDLVHLQPGGDDPAYLSELRLQNLENLDLNELHRLAQTSGSQKLARAAATINELAAADMREYETL